VSTRWDAAERALRRLHFATLEPLLIAAKKRRRLELFGIDDMAALPAAALDPQLDPEGCLPACHAFVAHERPQLRPFLFRGDRGAARPGSALRGVAAVIDLDRFADFDAYRAAVKRHSKGGILQQVKKAKGQGFYTRTMLRDLHARQCFEIQASKRVRSGLVLAAFRPAPVADFGSGITVAQIAQYMGRPVAEVRRGVPFPEPPQPPCARHWSLDWGAFIDDPAPGHDDGTVLAERLVAYVFLKRIGNLVRTRGVMAHGDYLARNVMKLLFHDVMGWLLARDDPRVRGVRYLHYGAIEHGNDGLAAWKRSFEFTPVAFRWTAPSRAPSRPAAGAGCDGPA
jgi:hypothetical protein